MLNTIVTPMTRGQITLPKKVREALGIVPGTPLNLTLEQNRIIITPLVHTTITSSPLVIKPKYSPAEYREVLKKLALKGEELWTKEDDVARKRMLKAEKRRWKKLNW